MTLLVAMLVLLQDPTQEMAAKTYDGPGGKLLYRLYTPKAASAENKLPLILFLHGAGERGDDNAAQLKNCMKQFLKMQEKYPAFIVAPQCPRDKKWNEVNWQAASHVTPEKPSDPFASLMPLLNELKKELPFDLKRLYVTGLSPEAYRHLKGTGKLELLEATPILGESTRTGLRPPSQAVVSPPSRSRSPSV